MHGSDVEDDCGGKVVRTMHAGRCGSRCQENFVWGMSV